jgi:hypothetical protein
MGCSLRGVIVRCPDAFPVLSSSLWEEFVGCCDVHFNGFRVTTLLLEVIF